MLLVGPCDAGKTTLWLQLRDGTTHHGTVASMQENAGEFVLSGEKVGEACIALWVRAVKGMGIGCRNIREYKGKGRRGKVVWTLS